MTNANSSLINKAVEPLAQRPASRCVSNKEAARILGLSPKTLSNWRVQGLGPRFLKYGARGGAIRYLVADLHAWQDAQMRLSTSST